MATEQQINKCTCEKRPASTWTSEKGPSWYRHEVGCWFAPLPTKEKNPRKPARKTSQWKPVTRTNSVGHDL